MVWNRVSSFESEPESMQAKRIEAGWDSWQSIFLDRRLFDGDLEWGYEKASWKAVRWVH